MSPRDLQEEELDSTSPPTTVHLARVLIPLDSSLPIRAIFHATVPGYILLHCT
jgi:hypothetical protein